jgi:hypothetical protein
VRPKGSSTPVRPRQRRQRARATWTVPCTTSCAATARSRGQRDVLLLLALLRTDVELLKDVHGTRFKDACELKQRRCGRRAQACLSLPGGSGSSSSGRRMLAQTVAQAHVVAEEVHCPWPCVLLPPLWRRRQLLHHWGHWRQGGGGVVAAAACPCCSVRYKAG